MTLYLKTYSKFNKNLHIFFLASTFHGSGLRVFRI